MTFINVIVMKKSEIFDRLLDKVCEVCEERLPEFFYQQAQEQLKDIDRPNFIRKNSTNIRYGLRRDITLAIYKFRDNHAILFQFSTKVCVIVDFAPRAKIIHKRSQSLRPI